VTTHAARGAVPIVDGLLERAVSDLQQGWHEAAVDALGRAIRASEGRRWEAVEQRLASLEEWRGRVLQEIARIVADVDSRLRVLEERAAKPTALAPLNEYRSDQSRRLDDEIKSILGAHPGWPTAKEVRHALERAAFHPMPGEGTVRRHLLQIRGKRSHDVEAKCGLSAPPGPAIIPTQ
jgi:hypothetical protein